MWKKIKSVFNKTFVNKMSLDYHKNHLDFIFKEFETSLTIKNNKLSESDIFYSYYLFCKETYNYMLKNMITVTNETHIDFYDYIYTDFCDKHNLSSIILRHGMLIVLLLEKKLTANDSIIKFLTSSDLLYSDTNLNLFLETVTRNNKSTITNLHYNLTLLKINYMRGEEGHIITASDKNMISVQTRPGYGLISFNTGDGYLLQNEIIQVLDFALDMCTEEELIDLLDKILGSKNVEKIVKKLLNNSNLKDKNLFLSTKYDTNKGIFTYDKNMSYSFVKCDIPIAKLVEELSIPIQ